MTDCRNFFDQPINSTNTTYENIRAGNTTIFFISEEANETVFEFSQGTVKVL